MNFPKPAITMANCCVFGGRLNRDDRLIFRL